MSYTGCLRMNYAEYVELHFTETSHEAIDAFFFHFLAIIHETNASENPSIMRVLVNTDDIDDNQQPVSYLVEAIQRESKHMHADCCIYVAATISNQILLHIINAILPMIKMSNYRYRFFSDTDAARDWLIEQTSPTC